MDILHVENNGQDIVATNYWGSPMERNGQFFVSTNAGAIRILLPRNYTSSEEIIQGCHTVTVSVGTLSGRNALEVLFDDGSDYPFSLHSAMALPPGKPEAGRQWKLALYEMRDMQITKTFESACHWRRATLPCLKPWK